MSPSESCQYFCAQVILPSTTFTTHAELAWHLPFVVFLKIHGTILDIRRRHARRDGRSLAFGRGIVMKLAHVSDSFAVSPQLQAGDMRGLADAGFSTVICNRPDGEEPSQPTVASIREATEAAGLAFHHIPVSGGEFPPLAIEAFARVRAEADGKVLAFCRTGTRSITLDALANIENETADERIKRAERAGYDLSGLRDRLGE